MRCPYEVPGSPCQADGQEIDPAFRKVGGTIDSLSARP